MKRTAVRKRLSAGQGRGRAENDLEDEENKLLEKILSEAGSRLPKEWTGKLLQAAQRMQQGSGSLSKHTDPNPGCFLEEMWRIRMRYALPGNQAMYHQARLERAFLERAKPPQLMPEDVQATIAKGETYTLRARNGQKTIDGVIPEEAARTDAFGDDIPDNERNSLALNHMHVITNVRPHGFSSVGKVSVDSDMGRILMHGLQLFMEITWNEEFARQLDNRHCRYALIDPPGLQKHRLELFYCEVNDNRARVPPAATQVPVFDHLSVSNQLLFVSQVVEGLVVMKQQGGDKHPSSSVHARSLPPDNVFCWAAFNKLVGLGMMATMEEVAAAAAASGSSSSSTGMTSPEAAAAADLRQLAAAREADSAAATSLLAAAVSRLRVSLHNMIQQQQHLGTAAMQVLAAVKPVDGSDTTQQQQQVVQQIQQQTDLAALTGGSSSSSECQQQQQLWLQSCIASAWPLLLNPGMKGLHSGDVQLSVSRMQPSQVAAAAAAAHSTTLKHHGVTPAQLIAAGAHSSSSSSSTECAGAATEGDQSLEQLLIQRLSEILLLTHEDKSDAAAIEVGTPSSSSSSIHGGTDAAAAAALPGLEFQAFVNLSCHLLLQRLLQNAPATTDTTVWTQSNMLQLLQLLLVFEKVKSTVSAAVMCTNRETCSICQQQQQQQQVSNAECVTPAGSSKCGSSSEHQATQQQQEEEQHDEQQQQQHVAVEEIHNAVLLLCQALAKLRNLRFELDAAAEAAAAGDQSQQQQQCPYSSTPPPPPPPPPPAPAAASPTSWRSTAVSLYKTVRPSGLKWLDRNFDKGAGDNAGCWGLVRYFMSADLLNLHRQQAALSAAAASSMWTDITLKDPDFTEVAMFSKQAARTADKALALFVTKQTVVNNIGAPVTARALVHLLRLACLAGEAAAAAVVPPLPYADLKLQAAAVGRNTSGDAGSSSSSSSAPCSASSSAATAAAAAARWQGPALHLGEFNSLGPMFDEQQQGPCLARMMELIAEYYQQHAQAAEHTAAALQQQSPPNYHPEAAVSSSGNSSSSSRLFVLLLGLYHMHMLEQQQHLDRDPTTTAAAAVSVYSSLKNRLDACSRAVEAAKEVMDLFIWCVMSPESSPNSSSSGSSHLGENIASLLMHDHLRLMQIAKDDLDHLQQQQQQQGVPKGQGQQAAEVNPASCTMYGCRYRGQSGAVPVPAGSHAHVDAGTVCDGCRKDFSCGNRPYSRSGLNDVCSSSEPEQDALFVCSHCGAAIMCFACFSGSEPAKMHLRDHCTVLQGLFTQHCELLCRDVQVAECTDDQRRGSESYRHGPRCRCTTCCSAREIYIQVSGQRFRYSSLQLLQVPWWVALHQHHQQQKDAACIGTLAGVYGLSQAFEAREAVMHHALRHQWSDTLKQLENMSLRLENVRMQYSVQQVLQQLQQNYPQRLHGEDGASSSSARTPPDLKFWQRMNKAAEAEGRFQRRGNLRARQQQQQQQQRQQQWDPSKNAAPFSSEYSDFLRGLHDRGMADVDDEDDDWDATEANLAALRASRQESELWHEPSSDFDILEDYDWGECASLAGGRDPLVDDLGEFQALRALEQLRDLGDLRLSNAAEEDAEVSRPQT